MTQKIGLLGGTFDPVHNAHLALAQEAFAQFDLDKVLFIPTGIPARKLTTTLASSEQRYEMLVAACEPYAQFEVSRIELDRTGITYTIDTLCELEHRLSPDTSLYFIAGHDSVIDMPTWKDAAQIAQKVTILSANRGESAPVLCPVPLSSAGLTGEFNIINFTIPRFELSSSLVRARIKKGQSVEDLVPTTVLDYIKRHNLYE